ncbi:hypothetical protein ADN00_13830 [Ornatilinea apprima]|uniref:Serine aminopeptidase S33 domain-containing protein n=1 Tax=Ornatilinea apprima TaxID=1134406 RepID=A0A0P6WVS5_9CHLR|nr:alpha/beta fold hydrolase [Ornatilinea apprima]KPL74367.1 hypothetical protein ADN00_13830 [Ornatilinea apprima]
MPSSYPVPQTQPFLLPGGSTGVILVHGFTSTPKEMSRLGAYLNQQGFTVIAPRLPGHALTIQDMPRTRYQDWYNALEDAYQLLRPHCAQMAIVGVSMGGALSLLFAANHPFDALVTLSAPYDLADSPRLRKILPLLRLLSRVKPFLKKPKGGHWFNPEAGREHYSYRYNPTRSAVELLLMLSEMQAALPRVTAPALLIHSLDDGYVHPANLLPLFALLGSPQKDMRFIQGSSHCVTIDGDRQALYEQIGAFLTARCASTPPAQ